MNKISVDLFRELREFRGKNFWIKGTSKNGKNFNTKLTKGRHEDHKVWILNDFLVFSVSWLCVKCSIFRSPLK